jgi:D-alanyl-D-alanine carboxypeptidase (penicillin-binding protein 5/6)
VSKPNNSRYSWKQTGVQILLVIIVAFAGVSIATQAAFPDKPEKSLFENKDFWEPIETKQLQKTQPKEDSQPVSQQVVQPRLMRADVSVDAKSYLVADLQTGEMLAGKQIDKQLPIASITKLMTAVVARETYGSQTDIDITESAAATYGNSGDLSAGDSLPLSNLYYPLLLSSSNDAATALAEHSGGKQFISQMNRKALAIGMQKARFADASGLSANNVASAKDLFALAEYIYNQNSFIFSITTQAQKTVPKPLSDESAIYVNSHPLHSQPNFIGGKNGYTDKAKHTLLSVFQVSKNNQSRPVVVIVLGSNQHVEDSKKLLDWVEQI